MKKNIMLRMYEGIAQFAVDAKDTMNRNRLIKKRYLPKEAEKKILELYSSSINSVIKWRETVNLDRLTNHGNLVDLDSEAVANLQKYAYAVGQVAALEGVMERFYIEYSDDGKIPELY